MAFRNTKESLQDIAELKEQELQAKIKKEKDQQELEELKAKIKGCINEELYELEKHESNLLLYYYNNKNEIVLSVYNRLVKLDLVIIEDSNAEKYPRLANNLSGYYIDEQGELHPRYKQVSKWSEQFFDKEKMLVLIDSILKEQLKAEEKEAKDIERLEQQEKSVEYFLTILNDLYNTKQFDLATFRRKLQGGDDMRIIFEYYDIDITDAKAIANYKKARKIMLEDILKQPQQEPTRSKKTIAGLSIPAALLGVVVGICEGATKKR